MAQERVLGMETGSATQHPSEENEHGVMDVMLHKEFQRCTRNLRCMKKTAHMGKNIRKGIDAGMESTGYVGDPTIAQFVWNLE